VVSGRRVNLQRAEQIYSDVQELRQLNFKTEVPLVVMDRQQARLVIEREVTRDHDPAAVRRAAEIGVLTGLYAPGIDLNAETMRALSSRMVAYYDPQDREMILVGDRPAPGLWSTIKRFFGHSHKDSTSNILVAHELTHALQDQHFGALSEVDRISDDDDRRLALNSVVEGDATMVGYGYKTGLIDSETVTAMLTRLDDMPRLFSVQAPGVSAALRDALTFQYTDGTRFVAEVYQRGGWSAVNELYRSPPSSTRQIMNSALYFSHSAPPTITLGGWQRTLRGWHEVAENTYGEFLLRVILTRGASGKGSAGLARAWRGDRMAVLQRGGATAVIWIVVFDDDADAAAFARTYGRILERIVAGGVPAAHHVERRGSIVLAIIGPDAAQTPELAPAVWRASKITVGAPGA
jgi:hypothetical protein